jgi:hypothetical protein
MADIANVNALESFSRREPVRYASAEPIMGPKIRPEIRNNCFPLYVNRKSTAIISKNRPNAKAITYSCGVPV